MVFIVPQFSRDEELFAWNTTSLDGSSNGLFGTITNPIRFVVRGSSSQDSQLTHVRCQCGDIPL